MDQSLPLRLIGALLLLLGLTCAFVGPLEVHTFLEAIPLLVRVLCLLLGGYVLALHLALLLRGSFQCSACS